ncbi:MAG TPA: SAM-dependent methyltransferase, partial [Bacteroidales bacterium]|nr:SAM-dependent methyltransferase [Bacteroidales bacterium]
MIYTRMVRLLKYFIVSRHRKGHGIHSPFVFELINNVFRSKIPSEVTNTISSLRKDLAGNKSIISVNDLGAGSAYTSSSLRKVSDISSRSSIRNRYARVLYNIARQYDERNILELGTSVGISTMFIALGAPRSNIISIEGCDNLAEIARDNFFKYNLGNINVITGDFDEQLQYIRKTGFNPSMVFIDGNHRKEPVIRYFYTCKGLIAPDSVIIFDDINYSSGTNMAWNEIKRDPEVSVSIDIFQMGFVFFRGG